MYTLQPELVHQSSVCVCVCALFHFSLFLAHFFRCQFYFSIFTQYCNLMLSGGWPDQHQAAPLFDFQRAHAQQPPPAPSSPRVFTNEPLQCSFSVHVRLTAAGEGRAARKRHRHQPQPQCQQLQQGKEQSARPVTPARSPLHVFLEKMSGGVRGAERRSLADGALLQ